MLWKSKKLCRTKRTTEYTLKGLTNTCIILIICLLLPYIGTVMRVTQSDLVVQGYQVPKVPGTSPHFFPSSQSDSKYFTRETWTSKRRILENFYFAAKIRDYLLICRYRALLCTVQGSHVCALLRILGRTLFPDPHKFLPERFFRICTFHSALSF